MPEWLPVALILLACPVGMCLMMWLMGRYSRQNQPKDRTAASTGLDAKEAEAARLRAEIDQLKAAQREPHEPGGRPQREP
ncbi:MULTISPECIES: hypothetical protein [Streptomyces]|uniref:hypothetical protein n=1 Tax=Streptomyces TaxID=1883 RepID=UPI0033B3F08B